MGNLQEHLNDYRRQLEKGEIQQAYRGLMEYMLSLRAYFQKQYPEYEVPGNLYFGYMDMTYFAIIPPELKQRKLKVALVFIHEAFRFEVWLSGANRQIQVEFSNLLREKGWKKYKLTANPKASDSILEHILVAEPDFSDLDALTKVIESGTIKFIGDLEDLLLKLGS
ncbi:MAG: hypothetical protein HGA28_00015 [Anaerolineaceae bacterium]|nr:hypothetical protein [Anaerolineaceae bacterium]